MFGNETGSSKTDTIVKLVLIFFISLLSFSVGTFVGKQVSDKDYKKSAAYMEDEMSQPEAERETASVDTLQGDEEEASHSLSDDEIESLTEEFVKAEQAQKINEEQLAQEEQKLAEEMQAQEMEKKKAKKIVRKTASQADKAAQRVAKEMSPSKNPPIKRKPNTVLPSVATSSIGKYTVQVASYGSETEAQSHANKLKQKGFSAFFIPAKINGKTWYRVSVGLFSNYTSATNFRKELLKEANISSAIVQKIIK